MMGIGLGGLNPSYALRSWFDRALLSIVEGLTTNGINVVVNYVTLDKHQLI